MNQSGQRVISKWQKYMEAQWEQQNNILSVKLFVKGDNKTTNKN